MQTIPLKGFRLSFQQKHIWQWSQTSQIYRAQCAVVLEGELNPLMFYRALQQVVDHYEVLHTTFYMTSGMELPMQVLNHTSTIPFTLVDTEHLAAEQQQSVFEEQWQDLQCRPFDLEHGPQLHAALLRTTAQRHTLLLSLPALCADASTLQQLIPLVLQAYEARSMGTSLPADEDELQYIDVSSWQNDLLQDEDGEQQQAFWQKIKLSQIENMSMPFQNGKNIAHYLNKRDLLVTPPQQVEIKLNTESQRLLLALSHHYQLSPESCLLAAWQILLWRLTDESLFIGLTCNGRPYEELATILGPNSWTVPFALNTPFSDHLTFEWVLKQTHQTLQEVLEKQLYFRWDELVAEHPQQECIFPISFACTTWPEQWQVGHLQASQQQLKYLSGPSLLHLQVTQVGERFQLLLLFHPSLFPQSEARRLATMFSTLLSQALTTPAELIGSLTLLTPQEQARQCVDMRGAEPDWSFAPLHQLFDIQAHQHPDAPAVRCGKVQLSYQEVEHRSNQLAHLLLAHGLRPGDRVALYQQRDQQSIISLLAVLKAGGCYVPLDEDLPIVRIQLLLEELAPTLLLCSQQLEQHVRDSQIPILVVEHWPDLLLEQPTSPPSIQIKPDDLAYVISTSGSTGVPKGVEIRHRGVSNYTRALCALLEIETGWHFATVSSLAADLGNTSIFCSLASGGCIHILPYTMVTDGNTLARYIAQFPLDVLKIVPSHLQALLTAAGTAILPSKRLILGGEALPWSLVEQMQQQAAICRLYNHYGPTEATIGALVNPLGPIPQIHIPDQRERSSSVPIGRPIAHMQFSIRDGQGQRVPRGVNAELYLAGEGLAAGYLNAPKAALERFVEIEEEGKKQRWYRTGDVVRENELGQVEFVGRQDTQIKLRGYRIELAEIEAYLRKHAAVRDAVVVLKEERLIGYIVPWKMPGPSQQEVREVLLAEMPAYLVPDRILHLEQLPLTTNGKVDRRRLPAPEQAEENETTAKNLDEESTPIEEVILGVWRQVLGVTKIRRSDDFFQLGGHSLLGTRAIARLRTIFGMDVPITWLFSAPTASGLARRITEEWQHGQGIEMPPIVPITRNQDLSLSFAQQRLWFLDQLEPGSTAYHIPHAIRLRGPFNRIALEQALFGVMQRHESLRTTFPIHDEQPLQHISPVPLTRLLIVDLRSLLPQRREQEAHKLAQQEAQQSFDLTRGPLLRCCLLQLVEQDDSLLLLTMHHIISDGWSMNILVNELSRLYLAFPEHIALPKLPIQYADYALWQRSWLQGEVLAQQIDYWKQQLSGLSPLELPIDHPRPTVQTSRGAVQHKRFPLQLSQQLHELSQHEGVTLFMTLLATFQVLLARYSGQGDIAVGTPIANRTREETEGLIGFFVNTLVLRTNLSDNPSFVHLLARVRKVALDAYAHQDLPFEQVVEAAQQQRDLSRSPLFQVLFELQNMPEQEASAEPAPVQIEGFALEQLTAKFELSMVMAENTQGLYTVLEYNTDLFDASTIQRFLGHFQTLLEAIVNTPEQRISTLSLLTSGEYDQLLQRHNQARQELPLPLHIVQFLAQQRERTPDRIAVHDQQQQLTYTALWQQAQHLAGILQHQGVGPETLVGLYMERSSALLVSILAIWQCAAAYVPLDPSYPRERLDLIFKQARVPLVLTSTTLQKYIPDDGTQILCLEDLVNPGSTVETPWQAVPLLPQQLAYVIYTSGSTGIPKGVMVSHEGMLNHLWAKVNTLEITKNDVIAQTASASFDISVWQLLAGLLQAAQVHILPNEIAHDPSLLLHSMDEQGISILQVVPSLLAVLLDEPAAANLTSMNLRWLIVTGEAMPGTLCQRWWKEQGTIPLLNAYGPTECSDDVTHALLQREYDERYLRVPIGTEIINTQIYVLDAHMELVPQGVIGEIYVGGIGVGRGYLRDPERTAEVFVPDPYNTSAGSRLYRTGDRGRYRQDGQLEFVERNDGQVKLRGYRIELGEIEALISQHAQIKQCVVVLHEQNAQDKRLVAYIVSEASSFNVENMRGYLKGKLPDYMLPDHFVLLEALPLTPNGKVHRDALPAPQWTKDNEKGNDNVDKKLLLPMEELILQVWEQVLQREQISLQDNFFEIGGHSLLATQIIARLRKILAVEIPLLLLFEAPNISSLAARLQQLMLLDQGLATPPLLSAPRNQPLPLSFAQQRLWFLHQFAPRSAAYTIPIAARMQGTLDVPALRLSLASLIQRHESLRTTFAEHEGLLQQQIVPASFIPFPLIDLSSDDDDLKGREMQRLVQQEAEQPFDLKQGPLLRCWLLRISQQDHILLLTMHHIVSDGWSMGILVREITELYQAFHTGQPSPLPPLPIQYADYASWQRSWLQGGVLEAQIRYWTHQLNGAHALQLPTDFPRSSSLSHRGARYGLSVSTELTQQLHHLSQQEGVTLFMTLLAAFQVLLYRISGEEDIVVGTDSANRSHLETESIIGFFINMLALRSNLQDHPSFLHLLQRVREMVLGAYAHQEFPFEMIVEHLRLPREGSRTPLINVLFVLQNVPLSESELPDIIVRPVEQEAIHSKFDLALFVNEGPQGLYCSATYNTELFKRETIETMMQRYNTLLNSIVNQPHTKITSLEIATENERMQKTRQQATVRQNLKVSRGARVRLTDEHTSSDKAE